MEIRNVLDFLGKDIEDINSMDLQYYFGYMREKRGIKMTTIESRMHYLSSFWNFLNGYDRILLLYPFFYDFLFIYLNNIITTQLLHLYTSSPTLFPQRLHLYLNL